MRASYAVRRIAGGVLDAALIILTAAMLLVLMSMVLGSSGGKLAKAGGFGLIVVGSGSMEPVLPTGALALVREQPSYAPGDVVTFDAGDALVTHRIVAVDGDRMVTQGDANNVDDGPVPLSSVEGKVVASVPGAGSFVAWLQTSGGMLAILGTTACAGVLAVFAYRGATGKRSRM